MNTKQVFLFVLVLCRKYCPAGCAAVTGDVSGDLSLGYRHVSSVSLFSSGVAGMPRLIPRPWVYLQSRRAAKQMLGGVLPEQISDAAARPGKAASLSRFSHRCSGL